MAYELEYDLLTELQMVEGESAAEYVNVVAREARLEIERLRAEHTTVDRLVAGQLSARLLEVEAERDAERKLADRLAVALEAETADPERTLLHADSMQTLKAYEEARREQ